MTERALPEPDFPSLLPPDLAEFLRDQDYACLTYPSDQGTVFIIKAPRREIDGTRGRIPIHLNHSLHRHPAAPVVRIVTAIYDRADDPLKLETFINVAEPVWGLWRSRIG